MRLRHLYPWDLSPPEAIKLQNKLRQKIELKKWQSRLKLIAGVDVSFKKGKAIGVAVVLDYPGFKIIEQVRQVSKISYPYIPGLLTFREGPVIEKCFKALKHKPDIIIFDGQGIAHPRNMGIATHMGILLDKRTVGCAKTWLYGNYEEPKSKRGTFSYLFDPVRKQYTSRCKFSNGVDRKRKKIGAVLRTKDMIKPVFVSPGHKMDIDSSIRLILMCTGRYRLPEPLRLAHQLTQKDV